MFQENMKHSNNVLLLYNTVLLYNKKTISYSKMFYFFK